MRTIDKIIKRLDERGQDQKWLAREIGVREDRISRWKDGKGEPTGSQLLSIARALGLPIEYLADPGMDVAPAPPITSDQRQILDLCRALKLDLDTALQRLACDVGEPSLGKGYTKVIGQHAGLPVSLRKPESEEPNPKPRPKKPKRSAR